MGAMQTGDGSTHVITCAFVRFNGSGPEKLSFFVKTVSRWRTLTAEHLFLMRCVYWVCPRSPSIQVAERKMKKRGERRGMSSVSPLLCRCERLEARVKRAGSTRLAELRRHPMKRLPALHGAKEINT